MRIIILLLLFNCCINSTAAQPIDWDAVKDRYVEKYQPQQEPAWLFPIIFKDGTGSMDTIYFGYDEDASPAIKTDTIFGELPLPADSLAFNAFLGGACSLCDTFSIADINIKGGSIPFSSGLEFNNGLLPITMYFDASFLEDSLLPFPDIPLKPNAQMEVGLSSPLVTLTNDFSWYCNTGNVVITDSVGTNPDNQLCYFTDSIVFTSQPSQPFLYMHPLSIRLETWTGNISGNAASEPEVYFGIYPNPCSDYLKVFIPPVYNNGQIKIVNTHGQVVYSKEQVSEGLNEINVTQLAPGLYFSQLTKGNDRPVLISRFIKL
jgi:type IX secretion system substrate protein